MNDSEVLPGEDGEFVSKSIKKRIAIQKQKYDKGKMYICPQCGCERIGAGMCDECGTRTKFWSSIEHWASEGGHDEM